MDNDKRWVKGKNIILKYINKIYNYNEQYWDNSFKQSQLWWKFIEREIEKKWDLFNFF